MTNHAIQRAWERHSLKLSCVDIDNIIEKIHAGECRFLGIRYFGEIHEVEYQGERLLAVYKNTDFPCIVTFLERRCDKSINCTPGSYMSKIE